MDHDYAIEKHAAEQYLLGELTEPEREEFEEHYFACPECAEAVRSGAYFVDNAQAALKEKAARPSSAGQVVEMKHRPSPSLGQRFAPAGSIAAAVLLAVVGYQNMVEIPALRQVSPAILARAVVRPPAKGNESGENPVRIQPGQRSLLLDVDVNTNKVYPFYRVEVQTQSGKSIMLTEPAHAVDTLAVELPTSKLPPGHYVLLVRGQTESSGQPGPEIARSNFLVKE